MLSARPENFTEGDPSCPTKRVNFWHYWLSDMKRIHKSGVVRLWMGTGFWHCEQDPFRGEIMWGCAETEPCSCLNYCLTFPWSPSFFLSYKERRFDRRGKLQDFPDPGRQICLNLAILHPAVATGGEGSTPLSIPVTVNIVPTQDDNFRLYVTQWDFNMSFTYVFWIKKKKCILRFIGFKIIKKISQYVIKVYYFPL